MPNPFTLIVCTYMRPISLLKLLQSVKVQTLYPNEILIIDGSTDDKTEVILKRNTFKNLTYFKVNDSERGLTKQRNFGISHVSNASEVICFLDDDVVLEPNYFRAVITTFNSNKNIVGVGGVALNENRWFLKDVNTNYSKVGFYECDNYVIKESLRNKVRNLLGLQSPSKPGIMPDFSHGRTYSYPLTGKNYEVDLLVGMSFSFKRVVFENIEFSTYFEGYGLYEDADYSIRALRYGKNVICSRAQLYHYHEASGRPNQFKYGNMVVKNGWYVWRVKNPTPSFKDKMKWHAITLLLIFIRFSNIFTATNKKQVFIEAVGRTVCWLKVLIR
ncbi:glycosyltransferase family 2 protein [Yeosuana sp.]|uniref:glycosyltransferase family 2 protein n=1 Tax=Yeosuana sp. TaxID=2529388 RepID=UPI004055070B|tara:strand:+ start:258 stop:1247 length:990 start_codon:yes stop_codon:yes gene_type:complete